MRILAISDIHDDMDKLKKLKYKIEEIKPDLVLLAGDITSGDSKERTDSILSKLENGAPLFAVTGNWDGKNVGEALERRNLNIHKRAVKVGNFGIMGFSGPSGITMGGLMIINYDDVDKTFEEVAKSEKTIVVSHHPPSNTKVDMLFTGQHVGSEFVRELVEEKQPDLLICGHIHEARGTDKIKNTTIVNPGAVCDGYAALIDFSGKTPKTEFIRI